MTLNANVLKALRAAGEYMDTPCGTMEGSAKLEAAHLTMNATRLALTEGETLVYELAIEALDTIALFAIFGTGSLRG